MHLAEIPFVLPLADWVWGDDEHEAEFSSEICLGSLPWLSSPCFSRLVIKGLGLAIILGSCLNKAPIMVNMWKSQSSEGMSLMSFYGETVIYCNAAFYGFVHEYPVSAYGENIALTVQSLILILLAWKLQDDPAVTLQERVSAVALFVFYAYAAIAWLQAESYYLLMASILPVLVFSRGTQILKTFRVKHTGAQSILTLAMNVVGGLIRILTTIKEVGWDMNLLNGFFVSVTLNLIMVTQYWVYHTNTVKFAMESNNTQKKKA